MALLQSIKKKAGRYFLNRGEWKRKRKGSNFTQGQSVLILYLDQGEDYYKKVKRYVQHLKEEYGMRDVLALGYADFAEKNLPHYQKHQLEIEFFCRNDLNWYCKPQGAVDKILKKPYDILIDLVFEKSLPMEFALAESQAGMKVGKHHTPGAKHCDIVLNLEGRDNIDEFLHQVDHYLSNFSFQ
ncbi:DUF6913 domain-containing protein [Halocola ammonii]